MTENLISKYVLIELREYLVRYSALGPIQDTFRAAGIPLKSVKPTEVSGERRQLVEQYYASLDLTSSVDVQKLIKVIEREISQCRLNYPENATEMLKNLLAVLNQSGYREENGHIWKTTAPFSFQSRYIGTINSSAVMKDWERMLRTIEDDPEDAITSARALVESVCKSILDDSSIQYETRWDIARLYKATAETLQLSPSGYDDQTFKQILGGCVGITQGLAEIRNAYGDAHGKGKKHLRASPRHARLAVNAAATLAIFLLETFETRKSLQSDN
jgi:hypothetical protein